VMEIKSLW